MTRRPRPSVNGHHPQPPDDDVPVEVRCVCRTSRDEPGSGASYWLTMTCPQCTPHPTEGPNR